MDLDDQLAALAAGELDDDAARALRARAAADPALAGRLARFERLESALRAGSGPVAMDPAAVRRMDAAFDEALAALPDGPLLAGAVGSGAAASPEAGGTGSDAHGGDGAVVDLAAARARRTPRWVAAAAAAAAVLAGVVVLGPGVLGGGDAEQDTVALDSADEDAQRMDDGDAAATMESAPQEEGADDGRGSAAAESQDDATDEAADDGVDEPTAEVAPDAGQDVDGPTLAGVPVQAYDGDDQALARLLTSPAVTDARSSVGDDGEALDARRREQQAALAEAGDEPLVRCALAALELEPAGALVLLGDGSHDGTAAGVAVLVRPDRSAVALALAEDGCGVLDRVEG